MGLPTRAEPLHAVAIRASGPAALPVRRMRGETVQPVVRPAARETPLSALEQTVVALSLHDDASSFADLGGLSLFLFRLFGGTRPNRLSDPKLEALRRFAVMAREGSGDAGDERCRFRAAGYTPRAEIEVGRLLDRAKA